MTGGVRFLDDLPAVQARRRPGATAVRDAATSWTYGQLDERVGRWAGWLAAAGVGRGDRVVAAVENSAELVALVFGAARAGAAAVPLSPRLRSFQLDHIVAETAARVVVTDPRADVHHPGQVLLAEAVSAVAATPVTAGRPDRVSSDVALLLYTSGSTAMPKGVVCPHRRVLFAAGAIGDRLRYEADDVVYCCLPFAFDYGLYQAFLAAQAGCALVVGTPDDAGPLLVRCIVDSGATVVPLVPTLAANAVRLATRRRPDGHRVRLFTNTGAELGTRACADLRAAFPGARLALMFGLTECKRATIAEPDADLRHPGTVGTALPDTEVTIRDAGGAVLGAGHVGEIVVRGPHVMQGYWGIGDQPATTFRRDPATGEQLLFTGDHGRLDAGGRLTFVGRRGDVYKQHGMRVSAAEVEAAAADVDGVSDAALVPPEGRLPAVLFAVSDRSPTDVLRGVGERLENQKVPTRCVVVDRLPLTTNGKVDKRALVAGLEA